MTTENILMNSMGFNNYVKQTEASVERFDSYEDSIYKEYVEAQENLTFIDTFDAINKHNAEAKLKMLSKINKAYGNCNRGIENYCRIQSLEAVDAAEKTDEKSDAKPGDAPKTEKKLKWYQTVWQAIKKFFKKIADFFKWIWGKITGLFKKNKDVHEEVDNIAKEDPERIKTMSEYLAQAKLSDEKDYNAIQLNPKMMATLKKSGDDFLRLATMYDGCVNKIIQSGDLQPAEEFIKVVNNTYKIDGYDVGRATNKDEMKIMESRIKTLSEKFAYNRNNMDSVKKWMNDIAGTRYVVNGTFKEICGTTDAFKINGMFKLYTKHINELNNTYSKAMETVEKTTQKYDSYVNNNLNSKSEIDQIKAYKIASTCTMTFRLMTNISNIYMSVIRDVTTTIGKLENNFIQNAKKALGKAIDTAGNVATKAASDIGTGAKNAYNNYKANKAKK